MRAAVMVESMYGNTRAIADAIAAGLAEGAGSVVVDVQVVDVATGSEDLPGRVDLVVVGGPTHVHGLSRDLSRRMAGEDHPDVLVGPGLRDWFDTLESGQGRPAAAFDTRFHKPELLTGSAAHAIGRRLRHHGWELVVDPESFFVEDATGPLLDGEEERARVWASNLVRQVAPA